VPTYAHSVTIAAPPERVWRVVTDVESWPELTASMTSVRGLDGPAPAVGARFDVRQPRLRPAVWTVTELTENTALVWENRAPGVRSSAGHLLEPADGGTLLTLTLDQTGVLAWPLGMLLGSTVRRYMAMEADGLKSRSERGR
jgi:uncharacterized membrane protein